MKYCVDCKLRGKTNESVCSRCGKPFRKLGVGGKDAHGKADAKSKTEEKSPQPSPARTQLDLAGMEHRVSKSAQRVRWMASIASVMLLLFIGMLLYSHYSYVMQYAEVDQLAVVRSESQPDSVSISYQPLTEGRIEFVRSSENRRETLVDYSPLIKGTDKTREFRWSDASKGNVEVRVRHRKGWSIVDKTAFSSKFEM